MLKYRKLSLSVVFLPAAPPFRTLTSQPSPLPYPHLATPSPFLPSPRNPPLPQTKLAKPTTTPPQNPNPHFLSPQLHPEHPSSPPPQTPLLPLSAIASPPHPPSPHLNAHSQSLCIISSSARGRTAGMVQGTPIAPSSTTDLFVGGTRLSNGLAGGGGGGRGKESGEAKGWWCGMGGFCILKRG